MYPSESFVRGNRGIRFRKMSVDIRIAWIGSGCGAVCEVINVFRANNMDFFKTGGRFLRI
jgi:hypothetical protein